MRSTDFARRVREPPETPLAAPQHTDDDSLNRDVVLVHVDGGHRLICGLESNAAVLFPVELLDCSGGAVDQGNDHLAIVGTLPLVHDYEIPIPDLLVDH